MLDDVFAELDSTRRERLAGGVSAAEQVLVTAAVGADVPELLQGRRFTCAAGTVTRMSERLRQAQMALRHQLDGGA